MRRNCRGSQIHSVVLWIIFRNLHTPCLRCAGSAVMVANAIPFSRLILTKERLDLQMADSKNRMGRRWLRLAYIHAGEVRNQERANISH